MDKDKRGVKEILDTTILKDIAETDEWFPNYLPNCLMLAGENEQACTTWSVLSTEDFPTIGF